MKRSERKDTMRMAVLDCAERAIVKHGLEGLKARSVAAEVGCALGALYTVFPDMDALALAVSDRTLVELDAVLGAIRGNPPVKLNQFEKSAAVERIGKLAIAYLDFATSHTNRWRAAFGVPTRNAGAYPDHAMQQRLGLSVYYDEALQVLKPQMPHEDRIALARTVFSAVHGMVEQGLDERIGVMSAEMLRQQVAMVSTSMAKGIQEQSSFPWIWPW